MNPKSVVAARIHPAIGIARVGNAEPGEDGPDYFIGPQVPNRTPAPEGGYRDGRGRLKRQAAEFRIYGYDRDGKVVGELTDKIATIEWHVHVANKKAYWYNFDVALDLPEAKSVRSPRRNAHIQGGEREKLKIDPGPCDVSRNHPQASFDSGTFFGKPVYLGEIRYSDHGRLLFLGGRGVSEAASPEYSLTTFANNAGWHDDTSDGPVSATVRIGDHEIPVYPAWVVTAPPNYAPDLVASQPLYDVILDALGWSVPPDQTPSFTRHILPIFQQFVDSQWVNAGFAAQFGWHGLVDFMRPDLIERLAAPPVRKPGVQADPYGALRRQIFSAFRDPDSREFKPLQWPPLYGDAFFFQDDPPSPRVAFAITGTSYGYLKQWMQGAFIGDYKPGTAMPRSIADVPGPLRPETLDHAALHFCVGGPFHPGCELTWPMRHGSLYRSKFRLRQRPPQIPEPDYGDFMTPELATADGGPLSVSGPGDLTKWLAVPWQTDTASCRAGYSGTEFPADTLVPAFWPSRVPNTVLSEKNYSIVANLREKPEARQSAFHSRNQFLAPLNLDLPYLSVLARMVRHFHELGILERREADLGADFPTAMYVETLPHGLKVRGPASAELSVIEDILDARIRV
jgi:hypothetical protein